MLSFKFDQFTYICHKVLLNWGFLVVWGRKSVCSRHTTRCKKLSVIVLLRAIGSTVRWMVLKIILAWRLASSSVLHTVLEHGKVLPAVSVLLLTGVQFLIRTLHHHLPCVWECSSTASWAHWLCLILAQTTVINLMVTWV